MPPNPLQTVVLKTDDYTGYHGFLIAESRKLGVQSTDSRPITLNSGQTFVPTTGKGRIRILR